MKSTRWCTVTKTEVVIHDCPKLGDSTTSSHLPLDSKVKYTTVLQHYRNTFNLRKSPNIVRGLV